jgi:hypothetical protein
MFAFTKIAEVKLDSPPFLKNTRGDEFKKKNLPISREVLFEMEEFYPLKCSPDKVFINNSVYLKC